MELCCCPLTLRPARQPVTGPDGVTYERRAVRKWLRHCRQSPISRIPMRCGQLVPSLLAKGLVEAMRKADLLDDEDSEAGASAQPVM